MLANDSKIVNFQFITLFPDVFTAVLGSSLLGKAHQNGVVRFAFTQIRDHSTDKHRTVDDTPYGGGEGMLLKVDVLHAAWKAAVASLPQKPHTILLSPQGKLLTQGRAKELAKLANIILVCGHYEGVDERFIALCVDEELSIGDYVLTGGELAAMVVADTVTRLIPGVVGNEDSISNDSLENGLLKYPQYTRPKTFEGLEVPEVLTSGDHGRIAKWRKEQMLQRTQNKRPDLLPQAKPKK